MTNKEPVLLVVFIETGNPGWYVSGITMEGHAVPLIRSEPGALTAYLELDLDEQVSFLRHKLSGVLQRGCDRLWGKKMKPSQIVLIVDSHFDAANHELTQRVADHFVEWMSNPPVVFYIQETSVSDEGTALKLIAGGLGDEDQNALAKGLPDLKRSLPDSSRWERAKSPTSEG